VEPKHVLVVDDEPSVLDVVGTRLKTAGYRVTTARTGNEALRAVRDDRPDLAVVDLLMPGLDGYGFCAMVKRDLTLRFPIVVISGRTDERDRQRALDAGAATFVAKPFNDRRLLDAIEKLLAEQTQPQEP
jgi:DNA-binding response OmpR family regulator